MAVHVYGCNHIVIEVTDAKKAVRFYSDVLVSLAARAGLDGAAVGRFLKSHDGVEAVRQEEARGRQLGIRGVPYFLLNGKTVVSGAQPVETFLEAIEQTTR